MSSDGLVLVLVAAVAALVGGATGVLLMARFTAKERERWDARVGPIESGLEDLREEWIRWQRKRNKRMRDDVTREGEQGDLPVGSMDERKAAIWRRWRALRGA